MPLLAAAVAVAAAAGKLRQGLRTAGWVWIHRWINQKHGEVDANASTCLPLPSPDDYRRSYYHNPLLCTGTGTGTEAVCVIRLASYLSHTQTFVWTARIHSYRIIIEKKKISPLDDVRKLIAFALLSTRLSPA